MPAENVLKSFLVKIGFALDEQKFRRFQESMNITAKNAVELTKGFVRLGEASVIASTVMGGALTAAAKQMEGLYFAAQRTGASAKELQTLSLAAEQVGLSAAQAQAAIEGLSVARRTNPGLNGVLATLHIDPRQGDNAKVFLELMNQLHAKPEYQGAQIASMFGIDSATFLQLNRNLPEMEKAVLLRNKLFSATGVDPAQASKQAHAFMMQIRLLVGSFTDLSEIIIGRLLPIAEPVLGWMEKMIIFTARLDHVTAGWSSRLIGLVVAIKTFSTAFGILGRIGSIARVGGAVAATAEGGAAVAGGVAAAEGGVLVAGGSAAAGATALLPVLLPIIAAAAIIYAAYAFLHSETGRRTISAVERTASSAMHSLESAVISSGLADVFKSMLNELVNFKNSIASGVSGAAQSVKDFGTNVLQSAKGFTERWEGHLKNGFGLYQDSGGVQTVGIGHRVQPGEDFSGGLDKKGAMQLFASDLGKATDTVRSLVHRSLNTNQLTALSDLAFNIGQKTFAHSTLLADVNKGDMSGAAAEFARWNKVLVAGHYEVNRGLVDRRASEAQLFRSPVSISQKTDIHIEGSDHPVTTGREVARQQTRVNADLARNFNSVTQ